MNAPLPTRAEKAREEQRLRDLQWLVAYLDHTCGVRPLAEEDLRRLINTEARAARAEAEVARLKAALQQIADWTPATCEMILAHEMGDIAHNALKGTSHAE